MKQIQDLLSNLPEADKTRIYNQILHIVAESDYDMTALELNAKQGEGFICPHCNSKHTRKNGLVKGVQRFVCKDCGKNFRGSTGCATSGLKKKELIKVYIPHLLSGLSIRKCAELTGICIQTSFDWRHKILSAFNKQQSEVKLSGICESDDVYFTDSQKGEKHLTREPRKRGKDIFTKKKQGISDEKVAVIVSADRKGNKHLQVVKRGRPSANDIGAVLKDKLMPETILCTDSHRSYSAFAKKNNIEHHKINVSKKEYKRGAYHVQHVNAIASDLKLWIRNFKGVSTKYLQNYLNWYAVQNIVEKASNPSKAIAIMIAISTMALEQYNNIPNLKYLY